MNNNTRPTATAEGTHNRILNLLNTQVAPIHKNGVTEGTLRQEVRFWNNELLILLDVINAMVDAGSPDADKILQDYLDYLTDADG